MKKLIFSFAVLSLVFATSCGGDDDDDTSSCTTLSTNFETALQAFIDEQSEETCSDYVAAAEAFIDGGCAGDEAASVQAQLDATDCSIF